MEVEPVKVRLNCSLQLAGMRIDDEHENKDKDSAPSAAEQRSRF
jgi:hypothetical protein